jgi:hypothetical protein
MFYWPKNYEDIDSIKLKGLPQGCAFRFTGGFTVRYEVKILKIIFHNFHTISHTGGRGGGVKGEGSVGNNGGGGLYAIAFLC